MKRKNHKEDKRFHTSVTASDYTAFQSDVSFMHVQYTQY